MALPDDTVLRAASFPPDGYDRRPPPDFGLYFDVRWQPPWPHAHVDWPDFGLPIDPDSLIDALGDLLARARAGQDVEVGCLGGHGRTGTALACLAVLTGLTSDPVEWTRSNYCERAIETDDQAGLARRLRTVID